jgi:hypothetical protein
MIGVIDTSVTISFNYNYYSAIADLHNLQFTVAHALGFPVFISRLLATDLNTESSTSNHYEVFLPFLVQSPWNLGTQLELLSVASSHNTDNAENSTAALRRPHRNHKSRDYRPPSSSAR